MEPNPPGLQGEALKRAVRQFAAEMQARIQGPQEGIGTYGDHALLGLIQQLERLDPDLPWEQTLSRSNDDLSQTLRQGLGVLQRLVQRLGQGRLVDFHQRVPGCDVGLFDMSMSQGMTGCMTWKGLPLFKTVYDFSLYSMLLWALRPATIIELGSGPGASAICLADLSAAFGFESHVYSLDIKKSLLEHPRVTFLEGDCMSIENVFGPAMLRELPHPWLLVEDSLVNVLGVLSHFHSAMKQGDYLVVEDSRQSRDQIERFLQCYPGSYKVDTHYTDFFGRNATCAQDSIFVRV